MGSEVKVRLDAGDFIALLWMLEERVAKSGREDGCGPRDAEVARRIKNHIVSSVRRDPDRPSMALTGSNKVA